VTISAGAAAAILSHARESSPSECCGLLIGTPSHVTTAMRAANLAESPTTRYLIDPHDHLAAIRLARRGGLQVVGAYHSHPRSTAVPSATDALEAFSDFLWIIAGLGTEPPELTAWTWSDGNFTPVPLVRVS
jgi:proteasome lid subunit RPN8/RPN11